MALRAGGGIVAATAVHTPRLGATAAPATPAADLPVSGVEVPELAAFDAAARTLVTTWNLPGAQAAVARDGRLVFSRAYGYADPVAGEPAQPEHLFRIASISKMVTTVGIMLLVEAGTLSLDDAVFPLLELEPPPGADIDARFAKITIGELLVHSAGFDSNASGDPQYLPWSRMAAAGLGVPDPPQGAEIIRFVLGLGLDYDPGTKSVYSNLGFNILGRVIEHASGQPYEDYAMERVLTPAGISGMRLGKTKLSERAPGEVRYVAPPVYPPVPSVFPGDGFIDMPYGNYFMDAMDSHGGWIATAADLIRFADAIDGTRGTALLSPATVATMLEAPRPTLEGYNGAVNKEACTGLGWVVQPGPLGREWAHTGALGGGTAALLIRNDEGLTFAFVTNTLPVDFAGYFGQLRASLTEAILAVETWPGGDLFAAS